MPKFITYQRPAPSQLARPFRGGRPGIPHGKPGKQAPKQVPPANSPAFEFKLPGPRLPKS